MLQSSASTEQAEKSTSVFPFKIRQLLSEGFAPEDCSSEISNLLPADFVCDASCEATNKDTFLGRVESYSCSSCQAFVCASIQPTLDFQKYEQQILELSKKLQTQHEEFCSWPDFPCPDHFWMVPVNEPDEVLNAFLERFKSACLFQHQLPTIKPEQLKNMALREDMLNSLLELTEDEQRLEDFAYPLNVQMAACIVALCGWATSPGPCTMNLPILTCTYCMRKAGLWNFYQLDGVFCEGDNSAQYHEGRSGDKFTTSSPPQSPAPCRMKLRSQDATRTEQVEDINT